MDEKNTIVLDALGMQATCWHTQQLVIKNRRRIQDSECLRLRLRFANLDPDAFANAYRELVKRHEGLRTTFRKNEDTLSQLINPYRPDVYAPVALDISCNSAQEEVIRRKVNKAIRTVTNLEKGPLAQAFIFKVKPNEHLFVLVIHHIISDAASLDIIRTEIVALYQQFRCDTLPGSYPDYHIKDIVKRQQAITREKEKAYWFSKLNGYNGTGESVDGKTSGFNSYSVLLSPGIPEMIRRIAASLRVSSFSVLVTGFYLFFYAYHNRLRSLFAISVSDRRLESDKHVVGHLMYKIYLGQQIGEDLTIRQFIRDVYLNFLRTCGHPMYNEREYDQGKISDAVALYLNYLPKKKPGPASDGEHQGCSPSCYSLSCFIEDLGGGIRLGWLYDLRFFSPEAIELLIRQYEGILYRICHHPDGIVVNLKH